MGAGPARGRDAPVIPFETWIWPVVLAPCIGSFISVIVARWREPRSIAVGRSACPRCGTTLGPADLVPLLSWLAARGRCRHCGERVSPLYPALELAALGVAGAAVVAGSADALWPTCVFGWTLLALGVIDWREYRLPDLLTLPLLATGLLLAAVGDPADASSRLIGALAGGAVVLAIRAAYAALRGREGMGLGDAKLLAAIGAWLGWEALPAVVLVASLSALLVVGIGAAAGRRVEAADRVAFGAFLCLAAWLVRLSGALDLV